MIYRAMVRENVYGKQSGIELAGTQVLKITHTSLGVS